MHIQQPHRIRQSADAVDMNRISAGWFTEAAGALAAVVFSVLGLLGVLATSMAAIATISLGNSDAEAELRGISKWLWHTLARPR